jgi:uncharacterized membrane protein
MTAMPSADERTMATLAHILQLVGAWIAPVVILLIKRQSRFVSFHALQAVLLQIVYMVFFGVLALAWFSSVFLTMMSHAGPKSSPPPPAVFIVFAVMMLGSLGLWIAMLVVAIAYGIKAGRGEWAEYPWLGRLARKILKIGPGGAVLAP